eukprot:Rmarinus@m.10350
MTIAVSREKPVLAIDIDEVLGHFVLALIEFYNATQHGKRRLCLEDFHSYRFCEVWGGNDDSATEIVEEFLRSDKFRRLKPVLGAVDAVRFLALHYDVKVVTSRQHYIEEETRRWLAIHFDELFSEVLFGNHWGVTGHKRTKQDMCREIGAVCLIDDNPKYAVDCAKHGVDALLFDLEGRYGWSKAHDTLPTNVSRVRSWDEVLQRLVGHHEPPCVHPPGQTSLPPPLRVKESAVDAHDSDEIIRIPVRNHAE